MKKDEISNFIDKSDKVFLLNDTDSKISHDIPFQDSCSGSIELTIEAESSIFIRNHYIEGDEFYTRVDNDGKEHLISKKFCHYNNHPYIPASSFKGMLRNTLEILSYGKLKGKTSDIYLNEKITNENNLHKSDKLDLSEVLFGTTELKGRVNISHFKLIGEVLEDSLKKEILGTPEAKKKKFGWKNYPISDTLLKGKGGNNDKVKSEFIPLKAGVKFKGTLRYHNLRKFELGALLSALSFHNTLDCYHNIGLAKALGYGKINIIYSYDDQNIFLKAFEEKINSEIFDGKILWHKSPYIKEILKKHSQKTKELTPLSEQNIVSSLHTEVQKERQVEKDKQNKIKQAQKEQERKEKEALQAQEQEKIAQEKSKKSQGLNRLKECKSLQKGQQIINESLGKKPKPTSEQTKLIQEFYDDSKEKKTKSIEKFYKKLINI